MNRLWSWTSDWPPSRTAPSWRLFGAALVALTLVACGEEPQEEVEVARPIKMLTLGGGAGRGSLEYPGTVQPSQNAEMAFEVPGRIIGFPVDEGQAVSQGATLARLDPADYEAARDIEQARVNAAKADYERYRELYASDAVSLQDLDVRRRNFEVAEAKLRTAQKALDDTRLRAPFSGIVARKLVDDFQNVQAKQSILILQDESGLEVVVNVPERDAALAVPGLTLEERTARTNPVVQISAVSDRQFPARITEFSTTADPVTRTFAATFAFDPPSDVQIRSGMTAKVILTVPGSGDEAPTRFTVPANAVAADEDNDPYVWKVDESTMRVSRVQVAVGDLAGADVEILRGLSSGDVIAISGVHNLREGTLVSRLPE